MEEEKKPSAITQIIVVIITILVILLLVWQLFGISIGDIFGTVGVAMPDIVAVRYTSISVALDYGIEVSLDIKNKNQRAMRLLVGVFLDYDKEWYKEREFIIPPESIYTAQVTFYEPEFLGSLVQSRISIRTKVIKYSLIDD